MVANCRYRSPPIPKGSTIKIIKMENQVKLSIEDSAIKEMVDESRGDISYYSKKLLKALLMLESMDRLNVDQAILKEALINN